ncbi:MAG: DUF4386 family protein [Candidatus Heimdallarchaeota archaeon]|nr:DUF4386 family protein [Candidatus Heimdallarchaeota archaeon]
MSEDRFIKLCGLSSIIAAVCYIGTAVFSIAAGLTKPENITDADVYLDGFYNVRNLMGTYGWFGIFGSIFTIPAILGYYQYLKKESPMQWIPAAIIYHGVILLTLGYIIPLIIGNSLAPNYILESDPNLKNSIAALAFILVVIEDFLVIIGTIITLALGIAIIAVIDFKKSVFPKWLNILAIVTGILSILTVGTFGHGTVKQVFGIILIIDLVLMLVWMIAIGFVMILSKKEEIKQTN